MGEKKEFVSSSLTAGQLNALVKSVGGPEKVLRILQGDLIVTLSELAPKAVPTSSDPPPDRLWREEDGLIRPSALTSDGTSGPDWIPRLEKAGYRVGDWARKVLCSPDFRPTSGVTYEPVVLPGKMFPDDKRITRNIRAEAARRRFETPNAELACLMRFAFSDAELEAMGLIWLITMHEPINAAGFPDLLDASRHGGGRWLNACDDEPGGRWDREDGFAFVLP